VTRFPANKQRKLVLRPGYISYAEPRLACAYQPSKDGKVNVTSNETIRLAKAMLASAMVALSLGVPVAAQKRPIQNGVSNKSCLGLHAGIRAQTVSPNTENADVMLVFVLLNDGEVPVDAEERSWELMINGPEVKDPNGIFGNGPVPAGGFGVLKPGESYEFGKSLPIADYFPQNGEYRVSWRGKAFRSPTISITISGASH
jgi:hypothetical protein